MKALLIIIGVHFSFAASANSDCLEDLNRYMNAVNESKVPTRDHRIIFADLYSELDETNQFTRRLAENIGKKIIKKYPQKSVSFMKEKFRSNVFICQ
jgi:hypothetical protein